MAERDIFDQLPDLPGEPPRDRFVSELERRVIAARTDVGPATPTDHLIEGVVPMPEIAPDSPERRRPIPLIAAAAAAAIIVIVFAVFASLDDEESGPVDVVTEPEDNQENEPAPESPAVNPSLPSADATSFETAQAWLMAVVERDDATFRAIHTDDALVKGSLLTAGQPSGTLNSTATAERYFGGWEGFLTYIDTHGAVFEAVGCEDEAPIVCTTSAGAFGPGTWPVVEMTVGLETDAGRVSEVTTVLRLLAEDGTDFFAALDQATIDEVAADFSECLQISWNRADCGSRLGEFLLSIADARGADPTPADG